MLPFAVVLSLAALVTPFGGPSGTAPHLTPRTAPPRCANADAQPIDVLIKRSEDGSLGVLVDQDNTVVTVTAQPGLQVGDVIVGVDGDMLSGRPVGQALQPGAPQYTFAVVRQSATEAGDSVERALLQLIREASEGPGVLFFDEDNELAPRAEALVGNLEAVAAPLDDAALGAALRRGFWRLLVVSERKEAKGGLTGYGLAPFCSVLGSYQAFIDIKDEQTAQVVEVVANANLGSSNIAALKGTWRGAAADDVVETYERTEYGGAPELDAPAVENHWACTYLSERLRVCRLPARDGDDGAGAWRVYANLPADRAQDEIARLMAAPVAQAPRDGPPDWADTRLGGGYGRGGYGGGGFGDGPEPMPDRM